MVSSPIAPMLDQVAPLVSSPVARCWIRWAPHGVESNSPNVGPGGPHGVESSSPMLDQVAPMVSSPVALMLDQVAHMVMSPVVSVLASLHFACSPVKQQESLNTVSLRVCYAYTLVLCVHAQCVFVKLLASNFEMYHITVQRDQSTR